MYKFICQMLLIFSVTTMAQSADRLRLATTTSTDNSGLLAMLHPPFEAMYNIKVDVIAVGTGKALKLGENGDVDVLLAHAPEAEKLFIEGGFGVERLPVMHNDFVLLGSVSDPVNVKRAGSVSEAMQKIGAGGTAFVSRGDDSGTHKKEMSLWRAAGISPGGSWYLSVGQGMGAVLKIADDKQAYTIADRGSYLAYRDKVDLVIVYAGAKELYNPYHVIVVNPARHPHVKSEAARNYANFIRSETGQRIIREFRISGDQLFYPDVID
jgi:tungstate transport system substrate-binding protein